MSDLVDRLRSHSAPNWNTAEAADRIEKLERALAPFAAMTFTGSIFETAKSHEAIMYCHADSKVITVDDFAEARHVMGVK